MAINFFNSLAVGTNVLYVDTLNDRVGIGTSTPDTGTNLHVLSGTSSGQIKLTSQANTQFQFYGDGNQDINYGQPPNFPLPGGDAIGQIRYSHGSNYMAFKVNNAEMVRFASNNNVGIGTTSPSEKLDVSGTIQSSANEGKIIINSTATNGKEYQLISIDTGNLGLFDGTAYRLWVSGSGNVGIGTTSPSNGKLQIDSTGNQISIETGTSGDGRLHVGHFSNGTFIGTYGDDGGAADLIRFGTHSGDERMRITSSGNVGIGTTTPSQKLHVAGNVTADRYYGNGSTVYYVDPNDSTTAAVLAGGLEIGYGSAGEYRIEVGEGRTGNGYAYIDFVGDTTYSDYGLRLIRNNSGANTSSQLVHRGTGNLEFKTWDAGAMLFSTTNSERMRITSGGNVGIGTSSPLRDLHISKDSADVELLLTSTTSGNVRLGLDASGATYNWIQTDRSSSAMQFAVGNSERLRIGSAGQIGIGGANYGTSGQVLTSNGSGSAPSWQNASGSSNWTLSGNNIYNNNSGSVGIGTTSPTTGKLVVHGGDIEVRDSTGNSGGRIKSYDEHHAIYFREGANNQINYYEYGGNVSAGGGHRFFTGGTKPNQTLKVQIGDDYTQINNSTRSPIFYDSNNTSYYVDPASTSNLEKLQVDGLFGSSVRRITNPGGATYLTTTSSVTGGLLIQLPTARRNCNTMMQMTINVYQYNTGRSFQLRVGGYNYSPSQWYNVFAYLIGDQSFPQPLNVRFGDDGTRNWIMIGETNTVWSYPQFQVTDFQAGYSGVSESWSDGWATSVVTSIPTGHNATRVASSALTSNNASNWSTALYAPTYYDSNNTAYYTDPAGTSNLNAATFAGQITTTQSQITTNIGTTSAIRLKPTSTTNTTGKSSIFLGTSSVDNYGISLRGARLGTDGTPTFELATHFNSANGTVALSIDNSQNATFAGDVGIGTTSPGYELEVNGTAKADEFVSLVNASNSGITRDWTIIGTGDRGAGLQVNDISGAKYAIYAGGYDLTFGKHVSSNNTYTTAMGIYAANATDSSPYVQATHSLRAPIFYDSNDTNYYIDPSTSGTSAYLRGNILINKANSTGTAIEINSVRDSSWALEFTTNDVGNDNFSGFWVGSNGYPDMRLRREGSTVNALISSWERSYTTHGFTDSTDMRAPIFYDSNNTAYYVDPASTSVMNDISNGSSNGSISYGYDVSSTPNTIGVSNWFRSSGDTGWYSGTYGGGIYMSDTTWIRTYNSKKYYTGSTSYDAFYTTGGVRALTQMRAPVYYDENNTGYYVDPASGANGISANLQGRIQVGTFNQSQTNSGEAWIGRAADRAQGTLTVQLGTGSGRKFEVVDSGWTTVEFSADDSGIATAAGSFRAPIFYDSNNTGYYVNPASTSNVSALTVNATNGITMGTVSGAPTSTRLKIAGIGNGGCALFIQGSGLTSNVRMTLPTYATGIYIDNTGSFGTNALAFNRNGTNAGEIIINSGGTTSYSTTSDYRLKENVVKLTNGIERVKQLKPKRFNFILDENKEIIDGFIAHEAKEVVPESVNGEKDEVLPNGDPVYQGIDQAKLVPLLTAALQEAIAKIEDLETRIQILENQ